MRAWDETPRITAALEQIEGLRVATAWPKECPEEPVALVTLAGERAAARRDDREYLTEMEYYVRVFTASSGDMRRLCAAVDEALEGLGYARTLRWEEDGEGWRQTAARYKIYG